MDRSRQGSSVVAHIVIPESLIRASKSSSIQHDAPIEDDECAPDATTGQAEKNEHTDGIRPETPPDQPRCGGIVEPQSAHLEDSPRTDNPINVYSKPANTTPVRSDAHSQHNLRPGARPMQGQDNLWHSLSTYSIKQTSETGAVQNEPDPNPRSVDFVELDPRSVHVGFVELDLRKQSVASVGPLPQVLHERPSVSRHLGAGARLQSIAASIVHPTEWHAPRRVSRWGSRARKSSIFQVYEKAKVRGIEFRRERWVQVLFEYTFYLLIICFIYFLLIGVPLWRGACAWLYYAVKVKFSVTAGFVVVVALAALYAFVPLCLLFEKDPPPVAEGTHLGHESTSATDELDTALLIPCYKSANIIGATLEAALKVFPPSHIFVIANGNSPTPLDKTEDVCLPYGVNHIWSPIGSKIVAQFVGCYAAKAFRNVLLIDDDCLIPPNFPIVGDRLVGRVKSIGYLIKSVGPNRSVGNWCQQAQDMEYKISGLQRAFAGVAGSATFPHGAISLWDREFLLKVFHDHPGFSISEDWFFGHSCRRLGGRIKMCSAIFVETETPPALFFAASGGSRGGFGEMTVFKQRFTRWNFFFVTGVWYNVSYIFGSWKLGWWEIGAKLAVFQEVYETLLYLFTPFILPISIAINPKFWAFVFAGTTVLYLLNVAIFNEVHLRLKKERVAWSVLIVYYTAYKVIFTFVNVASCYWSIYKYARYFATRYPKIVEDEKAVEVVLSMEEPGRDDSVAQSVGSQGRRFTVTAIPARMNV